MTKRLTDSEIIALRRDIGDTGATYVLSGVELQAAHAQAAGRLAMTRVIALRWMQAHYAKLVTPKKREGKRCENSDLFAHYSALLAAAEREAGLFGGEIGVGELKLNLNKDD